MPFGKCHDIISFDVVGNVDCVCDGYNSRIQSLDAVVHVISDLLDSLEQIEIYGKNSRKLYEEEFDIKKRIGMLEDIYYNVSGRY